MRARFIHQIGISGQLRIYWDRVRAKEIHEGGYVSNEYLHDCPSSYGRPGSTGIHNAYTPLGSKEGTDDWGCFGKNEDYPPEKWPTACAHCGKPVPQELTPTKVGEEGVYVVHQVFTSRLYNNASGEPEAGDVYYIKIHDPGECHYWDDCSGSHLHGMSPSGEDWDMDSRADNCTMKEDRKHRCWVRVGSPENGTIHIDKNGHTCAAGAGSVVLSKWHGFLHHGEWHT